MGYTITCGDAPQAPFCPTTTDQALPAVLGLLPPGPAWDGAYEVGGVQNTFWRAIANTTAYTYKRLCDYVDEFFCATVNESTDQWIAEYALGDGCDPFGYNLCAKVRALGAADCQFFVDLAQENGWVITCRSLADDPEPIAGCFEVGCTPMGPTPVYNYGSNLGVGQVCGCLYGEIVHHPEPRFWHTDKTSLAFCPVPGSNLGQSSGDPDCCMIVGYYDFDTELTEEVASYCTDQDTIINMEKPVDVVPALIRVPCDSTGNFSEYGLSYVWEVTVDIAASQRLQHQSLVDDDDSPISNAGNLIAGCTETCADSTLNAFVICFLEQIKPAHTTMVVEVIQP